MSRVLILAIGTASILAFATVCSAQEWSETYIENPDKIDKPRVLIVGDSIAGGYYPILVTNSDLSGKANFAKYLTSKSLMDPDYRAELSLVLKRNKFDVIHVNNGLHGLDQTNKAYNEGLHELLKTIRHLAPKAKLIWCMTTPIRTGGKESQLSNDNYRVIERNRIAAKIMDQNKIAVNNLYESAKDHPEYYVSDGLHFNYTGKQIQAKMVAEVIEKNLSHKAGPHHGK